MTVLFLTTTLAPHRGWGRLSASLIRALQENGVQATVLTGAGDDAAIDGADVLPLLTSGSMGPLKPLRTLRDVRRARRVLGERRFDVVHALTEDTFPVAAALAAESALVLHAAGTYAVQPLTRPSVAWLYRSAYRRADRVLCISGYTERMLRQHAPGARTCVVPLGTGGFAPDRGGGSAPDRRLPIADRRPSAGHAEDRASRAVGAAESSSTRRADDEPAAEGRREPTAIGDRRSAIGPGSRLVLTVGAIKPRKGIDVAIEAMARVMEGRPDVRYEVVGEGKQEAVSALEARAEALGIGDRVRFLGRVDDDTLMSKYAECDVFLLTPVNQGLAFEGFGLVYIEANAAGKPAVGATDCGAEEAIIDGYNGLLVPQQDPEATAKAVARLLDDRALAAELGHNGIERAKDLSWPNIARRVSDEYRRAVAEPGTPPRPEKRRSAIGDPRSGRA